ncbi:GNAT family N-acetyltransferase [Caulobacter hibisci]|uniref:N-acetyltransferase domain-containing protein n=1 Tax=Caulobacter hibisci TaxID=2035993 RepID=A0ABS0T022_9CAUL|nr:GNAT family N-acetyltransferase [Caulobacter hibisci]MBI1684465.1 hypothetical protein [Caulobacter hibisci]
MADMFDVLPVAPRQAAAQPVRGWAAPVNRFEAFRSNLDAQVQIYNTDARQEGARQDLMARHRDIERRLGRALPWSAFMQQGEPEVAGGMADDDLGFNPGAEALERQLGLRPAAALDDAAYEALIDKLREQDPRAMAGVKTRAQIDAERDRRFNALAQRAGQAAQGAPFSAFAGSVAGSLLDAPNLLSMMTGGIGATRGIAQRVLIQGGVNAAQEAAMTPGRISDARFGGPKPTVGEIAGNVAAAGVGGAAFELGGSALGAGLRRLAADVPPPRETAAARAVDLLEDADRIEAAVGRQDGPVFDAATAAVARGEDPRAAVAAVRAEAGAFQMEPGPENSFFLVPTAETRRAVGVGPFDGIYGWIEPGRVRIERAELPAAARGRGLGVRLYQQAITEARTRGVDLVSDQEVSADAQRVWASLERRGYAVERNPLATTTDGQAGLLKTPDGSPVYRIAAEALAPAAQAAPARSPLETEVLRALTAKPGRLEALARQGDAIEAAGGGLAATPIEASAAVERVALSVLRRGDRGVAKALAGAEARLAAGAAPAEVAEGVAKAVRTAARHAQKAEAARAAALDPPATAPAARAQAEGFSDPYGPEAQRQLAAKPEEADLEGEGAPPGLFDDLAPTDALDRAHAALKACAPP